MQFLYSASSSNELKALYILFTPGTPVHTNTFSTPQRSIQPGYTLQGATGNQCTIIAFSVYCQVLIYGWVNRSTFRIQILPRDSRYRRLSVRRDSNPRSRGWESNALTTQPTVLPKYLPEYMMTYTFTAMRHNIISYIFHILQQYNHKHLVQAWM